MKDRYDVLMGLAEEALGADDFELAAEFSDAESIARRHGEVELADRAFCNRCSVLVDFRQGADHAELKEILLSSGKHHNRFLAAYNTGVAYFISEDFERAHNYARRATALARELDDSSLEHRSLNLVGTLAARASLFDEAEDAFVRSRRHT